MKEHIISEWAEYVGNETLVPRYRAMRFDDKAGSRFYWFIKDGKPTPAIGVTTFLGKVMPESKFLTDWKVEYGKDWPILLDLTAQYGTYMHKFCSDILKGLGMPLQMDIDLAKDVVRKISAFEKVSTNMVEKNLISFAKFVKDFGVQPLLIEALLVYETPEGYHYCMAQDILAKCTYNKKTKVQVEDGVYVRGDKKGQPKFRDEIVETPVTEVWCIDMKSNPFDKETNFYDSHFYQLMATKKAVKQNFGIDVDRIVNWKPKKWKGADSIGEYALKEWKPTQNDWEILDCYEKLAGRLGIFAPKGTLEEIDVTKDTFEEMYREVGYQEFVDRITPELIK